MSVRHGLLRQLHLHDAVLSGGQADAADPRRAAQRCGQSECGSRPDEQPVVRLGAKLLLRVHEVAGKRGANRKVTRSALGLRRWGRPRNTLDEYLVTSN
jgi:hypothetical protein